MGIVIVEETKDDISISLMRDGEIGIITQWKPTDHSGNIVQRYKDRLIVLGEESQQSFDSKPFESPEIDDLRVRILDKGTMFKID